MGLLVSRAARAPQLMRFSYRGRNQYKRKVRAFFHCLLAAFVVAATTIALHSTSDWSEQCAVHQNGDGVDFRIAFPFRPIVRSTNQISFIPGPVVNSEAVSTQLASCHGRVGHRAGKCKAGVGCTSVHESADPGAGV